jgi:hypothetical protein
MSLRKRPGNIPVRLRAGGSHRWRPAHAVWVHDVLAFRASPAAWREALHWVTGAEVRRSECRRAEDAPVTSDRRARTLRSASPSTAGCCVVRPPRPRVRRSGRGRGNLRARRGAGAHRRSLRGVVLAAPDGRLWVRHALVRSAVPPLRGDGDAAAHRAARRQPGRIQRTDRPPGAAPRRVSPARQRGRRRRQPLDHPTAELPDRALNTASTGRRARPAGRMLPGSASASAPRVDGERFTPTPGECWRVRSGLRARRRRLRRRGRAGGVCCGCWRRAGARCGG